MHVVGQASRGKRKKMKQKKQLRRPLAMLAVKKAARLNQKMSVF